MINHSAKEREEASHATTSTNNKQQLNSGLSIALRRRAQFVIHDRSIDPETRAIIRYGLEINDPSLAELIRRVDAGETIVEPFDVSETGVMIEDDSIDEKIEALTDMICRAGDEPGIKSAALLVLMATVENASHPKALANTAKHFAFTRCGELNLYGIVDAEISIVEGELFTASL
ncbi:MAG TPA: hypothetical protein VFS76_11720 [Pyrinomonadaceae bacterium]|nr:hypothetical protein [Pyrinomonadaceae bacterium]